MKTLTSLLMLVLLFASDQSKGQGCTIHVSSSVPYLCHKAEQVATLTAIGGASYKWSPAYGLKCTTGACVSARPYSTATYTVTANGGACWDTITVKVMQSPKVGVEQGACMNGVVKLTTHAIPDTGIVYQWFKDDLLIPNATDRIYHATQSGNYFCRVTSIWTGCYRSPKIDHNSNVTVNIDCRMNDEETFSLGVNPNPFESSATVTFSVAEDSRVQIALYDISGKLIKTLLNENASSGIHTLALSNEGLRKGIYLLKFQINDELIMKKVTMD